MRGDYGLRGRARRRRIDVARLTAAPAWLFLCGRWRAQVLICSHCDRGQIYCGKRCTRAARRNSLRAAGRRYHASRRYRRRKNVTHQGSLAERASALLAAIPAAPDPSRRPGWRCQRCGRPCPHLVRRDFRRRRAPLDLKTIKTILGYRHRPKYRRRAARSGEWQVAVEKPAYDLTIFKLHCGKLTLKIYTKGERVLRSGGP
jgi:hypothetical protein